MNGNKKTTNERLRIEMKTFIVTSVLLAINALAYAQDPLPSWNDTAPKKAIVAFVESANGLTIANRTSVS